MQYRKEIDGLRALAILPVIMYHGGFPGFGGGYIGVDIFFVISGYLITSIILEEMSNGSFSLVSFYERRARRILPALSAVLFVTTILAYIFMPADLLYIYSQSLSSVTLFYSNIFFFFTNNYFAPLADEMPLLHTWSLAVEEQYYLFFPIMVMICWSWLGRKWLLWLIIFIAAISLLRAQYLASVNAVNENFYLILSRAWELFFGSFIAFISLKEINIPAKVRDIPGILGLLMIGYSIVFFDEHTPFPGFYALIPVVGTFLIIIFSDSRSLTGRILSNRILVFIGLLSYSLYLWHQPLFAFLRIITIGAPPVFLFVSAIVATFILAFLSWKYIEKPFRDKTKFNRKQIFLLSAVSIIVFLGLGLIGKVYMGLEGRFNLNNYAQTIRYNPKRDDCHTKGMNYLPPSQACRYFGQNVTWAAFGDSHMVEPAYSLAKKLEKNNVGLLHLSFSGCSPSILFTVKEPGCTKWLNEALQYLEDSPGIKTVFLGFRYSSFLFGDQQASYPKTPDENPALLMVNSGQALSRKAARLLYWQSFEIIITRLLNADKTIYILYPIPELPMNIKKVTTSFSIFSEEPRLDLHKTTDKAYYFRRNQYILEKLDSLEYSPRLQAIKPYETICKDGFCPAILGEEALYFDDNHLSLAGANYLLRNMAINAP